MWCMDLPDDRLIEQQQLLPKEEHRQVMLHLEL